MKGFASALPITLAASCFLTGCGSRSDLTPFPIDHGSGGAPPTGCQTDGDCASTPSTPFCNQGSCVPCKASPSTCPPGEVCTPAGCAASCGFGPPCAVGEDCCGDACVDTRSDPNDCGACGLVCPFGEVCIEGSCSGGCNGQPSCTGSHACCPSGCVDLTSDVDNCGGCNVVCASGLSCIGSSCHAPTQCNGGAGCADGLLCCLDGCTDPNSDPSHCGACDLLCVAGAVCVNGMCVTDEGPFNPTVNPTFLPSGTHHYTTIHIPAGITVYAKGTGAEGGTLQLFATGDVVIDGTLDLSGGPGTAPTSAGTGTQLGRAGAGGFTGEPYLSGGASSQCEFVAGFAGQAGFGVQGSLGACAVPTTAVCNSLGDFSVQAFTAPVASFGGGAGIFTGYRAFGSGGGGPAGGAPGMLGLGVPGHNDCSGVSAGGGAVNGKGGVGGTPLYDGSPGVTGLSPCQALLGGGGGGSIGADASADLAVTTTFRTGSGGGGGSADYWQHPSVGGTGGGGGGGGAIRIVSPSSITIRGSVLANGGRGGDALAGTGAPACDPETGAAGGGGSGGLIYLSAPSISVGVGGTVSAVGGKGGNPSNLVTGGRGGNGGIGRIRLSVNSATCSIAGTINPPLPMGCFPTPPVLGRTYIGAYPK